MEEAWRKALVRVDRTEAEFEYCGVRVKISREPEAVEGEKKQQRVERAKAAVVSAERNLKNLEAEYEQLRIEVEHVRVEG